MRQQVTENILMVRPANFGYNPETAENNAFQIIDDSLSKEDIKKKARDEFDGFVNELRFKGINVLVYDEPDYPEFSDSVFPNNWVSFHEEGTVVTYPMFSKLRRGERRNDVIDFIRQNFKINCRLSLYDYEESNLFLEGTGSMVFDRPNRMLYACNSVRTDTVVLDSFCDKMNYHTVLFDASDVNNVPIYHTNVMMSIGETFAVICLDAVKNKEERTHLINSIEGKGREIIAITIEQMHAFGGNMLQVRNNMDLTYLIMSTQAYRSLSKDQIQEIEAHTRIAHYPIPTIEKYGGGSIRCMIAEIFLRVK